MGDFVLFLLTMVFTLLLIGCIIAMLFGSYAILKYFSRWWEQEFHEPLFKMFKKKEKK